MSGAFVSMPIEALKAAPTVTWRHIDGPLLCWAGQMHWLTWRERLQLWLRLATIESIAQKRFPGRGNWYEDPKAIARPCTCHPDDRPPGPCRQKYAARKCKAVGAGSAKP